jgi:hypothetical protein
MVCYISDNFYSSKIEDDYQLVLLIRFMNFISAMVICSITYSLYAPFLSKIIIYSLNEKIIMSRSNQVIL